MSPRARYNPKGVPDDTHAGSVEIIASGNVAGDNGNWQLIIVGNNFEVQKRIGDAWVSAGRFIPPP